MKIIKNKLSGLLLIIPKVFYDDRGYFFESFNQKNFDELIGKDYNFVQDNESKSQSNVIRGLHFQKEPYEQAKLIRVIKGSIMDVVVDIRPNSKTFGQSLSFVLNEYNKNQLLIPTGFAHGFKSIEDETIISYKCTEFYNKDYEDGIDPFDKDLKIYWGITNNIILSDKDKNHQSFSAFKKTINGR